MNAVNHLRGTCRVLALTLSFLSVAFSPTSALATGDTAKKKPVPKVQRFSLLVDGEAAGLATLRVTHSATARYASWRERPTSKKATPIWVIHSKRSDDALRKYQRLEDKRLGAGVIAFSKGNMVRIVGKNQKRAAIEIETSYHALWDPMSWLSIWDWPARLKPSGDAVRFAMYNVQTGTKGTVDGVRSKLTLYKKSDGSALLLNKWVLTGLMSRPFVVVLSEAQELVLLKDGSRTLIRDHLTESAPVVEKKASPASVPPTEEEAVPPKEGDVKDAPQAVSPNPSPSGR